MFEDVKLMLILLIIYIICVFIEIKALKGNNIDIFYKENFLLVLIISSFFPLSIFTVLFGYTAIKEMIFDNEDNLIFCSYFFIFTLAFGTYIVRYIRTKIYSFIAAKNKLSFLKYKSIYDKKEK